MKTTNEQTWLDLPGKHEQSYWTGHNWSSTPPKIANKYNLETLINPPKHSNLSHVSIWLLKYRKPMHKVLENKTFRMSNLHKQQLCLSYKNNNPEVRRRYPKVLSLPSNPLNLQPKPAHEHLIWVGRMESHSPWLPPNPRAAGGDGKWPISMEDAPLHASLDVPVLFCHSSPRIRCCRALIQR